VTLLFAALSLAAPLGAQGTVRELAGPAGRAWAGVGPETPRARLSAADLPPARETWAAERPWLEWAELLALEAEAQRSARPADGRRRARLALIAWSQGRSDDAWDHLAACTAEPAWMAAAVPHLAPGVPFELALADGFDPSAPLPDGVHLRPALPPAPVPAAEVLHGRAWIEPRELFVDDLSIGAGRVALRVALEVDGVQVEVEHVAGDAVTLSVTLPEPLDFEIQVEYLNWVRRDQRGPPIEVRVDADQPKAYVFGRFRPRRMPWSETLPERGNAQLERHGIEIWVAPGNDGSARLAGFAAALQRLFGWEARVRELDRTAPPEPWPGIALHFGPGPELEHEFTGLVSLVERYALEPEP
jgi:hypothetical protein